MANTNPVTKLTDLLDRNRGKVASVLAVVAGILTQLSQGLNSTDKVSLSVLILGVVYKYLDGNSKYEVSQAYNTK